MSRTCAGFSFTCKVCGKKHLMRFDEPHNGIRLPCANNKYAISEYKKSDFIYWHGICYWDDKNSVEEIKD